MPPSAQRALEICEALPDQDLIDMRELSAKAKISLDRMLRVSMLLLDNRHVVKGRTWFGNKRTIAALRKHLAQ